jgi:thiol-disulfide isomerase/thioredoxin
MFKYWLVFAVLLSATNSFGSSFKKGEKLPEFNLANLGKSGKLKSSSLDGKVVIVDFWASWCEPCKKSFPIYNELYTKYAKNKAGKFQFVILGINVDDEKKSGEDFLKSTPVKFPTVYDEGKKLINKAGISTMPTAYIVDKKGKIHEIHKGFRDGDEKEMEKLIQKLIGG